MPLEISEDFVSLAYQSLGYFVIEGRKAGRREIDLLAIRLGALGKRSHILGAAGQIDLPANFLFFFEEIYLMPPLFQPGGGL